MVSWARGRPTGPTSLRAIAEAEVTIIYRYTPSNCLSPGDYTIVQTAQPHGFNDGLESRDGVVIPGSGDRRHPRDPGRCRPAQQQLRRAPDRPAASAAAPAPAASREAVPSRLSGFVYFDANNNGILEGREFGIANVTVTLTGTDELGQSVLLVTMTATDGSTRSHLPGSYTITETQPTAFITGKDTIGSLGGITRRNQFSESPCRRRGRRPVQFRRDFAQGLQAQSFPLQRRTRPTLPARRDPEIRFFLPGLVDASRQGSRGRRIERTDPPRRQAILQARWPLRSPTSARRPGAVGAPEPASMTGRGRLLATRDIPEYPHLRG